MEEIKSPLQTFTVFDEFSIKVFKKHFDMSSELRTKRGERQPSNLYTLLKYT